MLTREAWNAFLKTLEEPPPNTVFVLCTTEPHKVMPTIVDRCQRFDFQRPSLDQIAEVVRRVSALESIEIEPGAVAAIARAAGGSFRDALKHPRPARLLRRKAGRDRGRAGGARGCRGRVDPGSRRRDRGRGRARRPEASERLNRSGRDVAQFGRDLLAHLRQLLVIRTVGDVPDTFSVTAADPERLRDQAEAFSDLALARAIDTIAAALAGIKEGDEPRMTLELAVLRAARPAARPDAPGVAPAGGGVGAVAVGNPRPLPTPTRRPPPTSPPRAKMSTCPPRPTRPRSPTPTDRPPPNRPSKVPRQHRAV